MTRTATLAVALGSQPFAVRLAFLISLTTAALTVAFLALTGAARTLTVVRQRRRGKILELWRPIMLGSLSPRRELLPAPRIRRTHRTTVLGMWTHLQESLAGDAKDRLNSLARRARLDGVARRMLRTPNAADQLLAVIALGHLGDREKWDALADIVRAGKPTLSSAAARAMVRIDAQDGLRVVAPMILSWTDWHPSRIAAILNEAGSEAAARVVTELIEVSPSESLPRLIRYLEVARNDKVLPIVRRVLEENDDAEVLAAALHVFGEFRDRDDAPLARRHVSHPQWFVRLQAVTALGKLGGADDERPLTDALGDREWWVRYRAAQALTALPSMTSERLVELRTSHPDRYARDAVAQVLAERGIA